MINNGRYCLLHRSETLPVQTINSDQQVRYNNHCAQVHLTKRTQIMTVIVSQIVFMGVQLEKYRDLDANLGGLIVLSL